MTARETFKVLLKERGVLEAVKHFFPIHIYKGQVFLMRPVWYNGHFMMQSINKVKNK